MQTSPVLTTRQKGGIQVIENDWNKHEVESVEVEKEIYQKPQQQKWFFFYFLGKNFATKVSQTKFFLFICKIFLQSRFPSSIQYTNSICM